MDYETFLKAVDSDDSTLTASLSPALQALRFDKRGDWDQAHTVSQTGDPTTGAWVHAYLHRKEGDTSNAAYWYQRANKAPFTGSLEEEWDSIVRVLLKG